MKIKNALKLFFYETFRKRSIDDYKDVGKSDTKTKIPWLYFRILLIGFIVFSLSILIDCIFGFSVDDYIISLGSIFFNLTFLLIPIELDNNKELSIFQIFLIVIISLSSVLLANFVVKYIWITDNEYFSALRAGVCEEIEKAIYSILIVYILQLISKRKFKISTILLIGFSVGAGFSIAEDISYISGMFIDDYEHIASTTIIRGITSFHGHIAWTGLITYAFFKFKKPFINYRFYLVLFGAMIVHTIWDITEVDFINQALYDCFYYLVITSHLVLSIAISLIIILKNNNKDGVEKEKIENDKKLSRLEINRIIIYATVIVFLLIGYQLIYLDENSELYDTIEKYEYYDTFEHFKEEKQLGKNINVNREREYDYSIVSEYEMYEKGVLVQAEQVECCDDITYVYNYRLDEETNKMVVDSVTLIVDGVNHYERYLYPMDEDDKNDYIYYDLTERIIIEIYTNDSLVDKWYGIIKNHDDDYQDYEINRDEEVYTVKTEYKMSAKFYLIIFSEIFVIIIGGASLIIVNAIKNKKEKNATLCCVTNDNNQNIMKM